jgi:hypothetical protein
MEDYKDLILYNIISFGRKNNPISAKMIYDKTDKTVTLDVFQRIITKVIVAYEIEQEGLLEAGKPYNLILSSTSGYFLEQSAQEAQDGINFYCDRLIPMYTRMKRLIRLAEHKYKEKQYRFSNEVPTIKQESFFN